MAAGKGALKTCPERRDFHKRSDCPTCPVFEAARKPGSGFLADLVAPARRALEGEGITTLSALAGHTEAGILRLHGMGPSSLPRLRRALAAQGLSFKAPGAGD